MAVSLQPVILFFVLAFSNSVYADSFLPSPSGDVVIEAENFDANVSQRGRSWAPEFSAGYVGNSAMQAIPNNNVRVTTDIDGNSPRMDYRVTYTSLTTLNVWVRGLGPDYDSDSIWIGINGDSANAVRIIPPQGTWGWATSGDRLVIPAGTHTINVWMREDGSIVDRLYLTPSSTQPTGAGDPESARGDVGEEPSSNTWPVANDDTFDVVNDGTSHALPVLANNGSGADFDPDGDAISIVSVAAAGSGGSAVAINAAADGLVYTPAAGQSGTDAFDYTISDGNGGTASATVTVNVTGNDSTDPEPPGGGTPGGDAYVPDGNGRVTIEAENYDANVSRRGRSWVPEFRPGYVGNSAMHAIPNNNVRITEDISSNSPRMDYRVNYPSRRSVNIWVRAYGINGNSDSVWVGIDGDSANAIRVNTGFRAWEWATANEQLVIPAGEHTINIWMREDGTVVDRFQLSPSSTAPAGNGGPESVRGDGGQGAPPNVPPIANDDTFDVVNDGTSHALPVLANNGNGADADSDGDAISIVSVVASGSSGSTISVNAAADGLVYTPAADQSGTDSFDYTISDGNGGNASATVTVNVTVDEPNDPDPPGGGGSPGSDAFLPDGNGRVTIEAENYDANVSRRGRNWVPEYRSGYVGNSAMHAIPNNNVRITEDISSNSPRMDYRVNYPSSRTVNVWVRAWGLNGNSDSVWVGIDGDSANAIRINTRSGAWQWATASTRLVIPAGEHTINIWMREDGTVVDRFQLSPSSSRPSGNGPGESVRGDGSSGSPPGVNNPPVISGNPPTTVNAASSYSFTPTASDADGQSLTFSASGLPQWASFDSSSGRIAGTPGPADVGTYNGIVISVSDNDESASLAPFSITVNAVNAVGSATLNWTAPTRNEDGSLLNDLAGYRILWGTSPGSYPNSVTVNNPGITTFVVDNLAPGAYEFVTRSINTSGVESRNSNRATKTVP